MCQVAKKATARYINVLFRSLCAELQKGVSQQCLVMANMVLLAKSCTVVSTPHSSALTQPKVLMSRSPAKTFGAVQCKLYVKGSKVRLLA